MKNNLSALILDEKRNTFLQSFCGARVFITGHTGFKGSWLAFLLNQMGADVVGYALPPATSVNHFELLGLNSKIKHIVGDIRDSQLLMDSIIDFQPEYVLHLAAQALVRPSYDDPVSTFSTNVMGSVNLLESIRHCNSVRSLVFVTSDKCYENVEWIWGYRESDQLGGRDPYSASKAAAELIFSSYARSYFFERPNLGVASARAGNVIGGGDWALDRIIPDCIRSIEEDRVIKLRNPYSTRPWQHVLEPIAGYLMLAARIFENPNFGGGAWNFGPNVNQVRTVESVAKTIINQFGKGNIEVAKSEGQLHEANLLQLNCDKALQLLEWKPRWNVDQTLAATASWYKRFASGESAEVITNSQIQDFFRS